MQISDPERLNFVEMGDVTIENDVKIQTPFYSAHIDKPAFLRILLDNDLDMSHTAAVTFDMPNLNEAQAQMNIFGNGIEKVLKNKMILLDPRSEAIYYGFEEARDGLRKVNNSPLIRNILRDANTKNHDSVWFQNLENVSNLTKFAEFCVDVQHGFSTIPLPITPLINRQSSAKLIDLAFQINRESHGIATRSFGYKSAGFYLNLDCNLFDFGSDMVVSIMRNLEDTIKTLDDVLFYIRFNGSDNLSFEGTKRIMAFLNQIYRKRHENEDKHTLLMTSGLNTEGILGINNGAEGVDEVVSGKNSLSQGFSRIRKKKEKYYNFSKYYNPTDMEEEKYEEIVKFLQEKGALPCTENVCKRTAPFFSQLNYREYAEFNRKHRIESRNREIRELKKEVTEGSMRGLEDRFGRSRQKKIQKLAELVS